MGRMFSSDSLKNEIANFVASYYAKTGEVPSVRMIVRKFRLNRTAFYKIFPGKLAELCQLASVPAPQERLASVQPALVRRAPTKQVSVFADIPATQVTPVTIQQAPALVRSESIFERFQRLYPSVVKWYYYSLSQGYGDDFEMFLAECTENYLNSRKPRLFIPL